MDSLSNLKEKAKWVKRELLKIHKIAPGTRLASSLSCIEILTTLYYGKILTFDSKNLNWEKRDRFIISKGHGSIALYPILADLGFFNKEQLKKVGKPGGILGDIPDCTIPGYETINGSLGHGLGVASGISIALKNKKRKEKVYVLSGDGELYEGAMWEAIMFSGNHNLNNLVLIVDYNKICMLDYLKNILDIESIEEKFKSFGWSFRRIDGHDIEELKAVFREAKKYTGDKPLVIIADTVKGKGVPSLECDHLCHVKGVNADEIDILLSEME